MADDTVSFAPGWPGIEARWTSSAKSGIGTATSRDSRVWFTLSHGILNEVYYPRVDHACTRDLGFIVTDGRGVFLRGEARRLLRHLDRRARRPRLPRAQHRRRRPLPHREGDPRRPAPGRRPAAHPLRAPAGHTRRLRVHVLLAPHLANHGRGNTAWVGDYKGAPDAVRRTRAVRARARLHGAVARAVGGVRRRLRRLAGTAGAQAARRDVRARGERQRRPRRRDRSARNRTARS